MGRLTVDGNAYRLEINGKQFAREVDTSYQTYFSKDLVKSVAIYVSDEKTDVYRFEDAVLDCKSGVILDFKIHLIETDFICHQGKCKVKKVSKHYPDGDATRYKVVFEVI